MPNSTTTMNSSNPSADLSAQHGKNAELLQFVILSSVGVFGICGNVLILITGVKTLSKFFRIPKVGSYQDYRASFITSLAIADIMCLGYGVPVHLMIAKQVPMHAFVCRVMVPLRDVFPLISILTIMAISVERAVAIVNPFAYELTQKHTKYGIIVTWLTGYLLGGLPMVFVMHSGESNICSVKWKNETLKKLHQTLVVLMIVIPGLITTCSYMFCLRALRKFRRRRKGMSDNNNLGQLKFVEQSRSISRIAVALIVVYWVCNLPLVLYAILVNNYLIIVTPVHVIYYSTAILSCLYFSASMISPIVLIVMSPVYRRGATGCLYYWCTKRKINFNYSFSTRTHSLSRDLTSKSDPTILHRLQESVV